MHSPDAAPKSIHSRHRTPASRLLGAAIGASAGGCWEANPSDAYELRYPATLFVWARWFIFVTCLTLLIYHPDYTPSSYAFYVVCLSLLAGLNGYVHHRVRSGQAVTLYWMLALSALDVALITASMVFAGDFSNYLFYLLYYPTLAWFAVFFSSFRLTFAWVTMVAVIYAVVSLTVGEGISYEARDDKALIARIAVMYAVVTAVNLVSSSERRKRLQAVERERALQRERVELSRSIHDKVAQSVYVVGLGIETARDLASNSGDILAAKKLDETYTLSRTALWELRHPIDSGRIFEGIGLEEALSSHAHSFTAITSLPVEVARAGEERDLPSVVRGLLFGIVHNAMTNVLLHAEASRVDIRLEYQADQLCMTVSDDGVGMPREGGRWGHGLRSMATNAERLGGHLEVSPGVGGIGTKVTWAVPYQASPGGLSLVN